jgi:hypothetical protein
VTLRDGTAKVSVIILAEIAGPASCHFDRRLPSQQGRQEYECGGTNSPRQGGMFMDAGSRQFRITLHKLTSTASAVDWLLIWRTSFLA